MREYYPEPIRVVLPGMCYRNEQVTARSEIQFTQMELLAVGENITFADLKGTLTEFARRMFGADRQTRFRASYFPFTEPSAEMDNAIQRHDLQKWEFPTTSLSPESSTSNNRGIRI